MKMLITGGNTQTPIDSVRSITNIFKGKTSIQIAAAANTYYEVTLLGNKEMSSSVSDGINFVPYRTYDELYSSMESLIKQNKYDVIIHSAAVGDYKVDGVYDANMQLINNDGKVGSSHNELYLKLVPTEKIVDKIRDWGFGGKLVKFKLQVNMSDEELIKIAEASRLTSNADFIVANCLEWAKEYAYIMNENKCKKVARCDLGIELIKSLGEHK